MMLIMSTEKELCMNVSPLQIKNSKKFKIRYLGPRVFVMLKEDDKKRVVIFGKEISTNYQILATESCI